MDTKVENNISHIELASVNFDQWILTIAIRAYSKDQSVLGMVHVIFKGVRGFRYLDEGDMLQYPFPQNSTRNYVQLINTDGWLSQESDYGNIVTDSHKEYLISTINECVCVLSTVEPEIIKEL